MISYKKLISVYKFDKKKDNQVMIRKSLPFTWEKLGKKTVFDSFYLK